MINLKIQALQDTLKKVVDKAVEDGIAEYAILLILEKTTKEYVQSLVQLKMEKELDEYKKESRKAKSVGGPVTEDLQKEVD